MVASAAASTAATEPAATQLRRVVCLGEWGRGMVASLQQQAQPPQSQQQRNHVELYVAGGRDVKLLTA